MEKETKRKKIKVKWTIMTRGMNKESQSMTSHSCHCEEGARANDAAIHRVSGDTGEVVCSLIGSQWIATGFALAMTRWGKTAF